MILNVPVGVVSVNIQSARVLFEVKALLGLDHAGEPLLAAVPPFINPVSAMTRPHQKYYCQYVNQP